MSNEITPELVHKRSQILPFFQSLVEKDGSLRLGKVTQVHVPFYPARWATPALQYCPIGHHEDILLQFSLYWEHNQLRLLLYIRPGLPENRDRLYHLAKRHRGDFDVKKHHNCWTRIVSVCVVTADEMETLEVNQITNQIEKAFNQFRIERVMNIERLLDHETWIWNPSAKCNPFLDRKAKEGNTFA